MEIPDTLSEFRKSSSEISCLYLIYLGPANKLSENIKGNKRFNQRLGVYKFGRTKDLVSRLAKHWSTFSEIDNCTPQLQKFAMIEDYDGYLVKAENELKLYLKNLGKLCEFYDGERYGVEYVILNKQEEKKIINEMNNIYCKFNSKIEYIKMKQTEELSILRHRCELLEQHNNNILSTIKSICKCNKNKRKRDNNNLFKMNKKIKNE